jgi:hypothetical protein
MCVVFAFFLRPCSHPRACLLYRLIHSDTGDTTFTEFMKRFIQTIEDRDNERNNCRMDDYATDFTVGIPVRINRPMCLPIVQKVRSFELNFKDKLEQKEAKRLENMMKNRYRDILPCELNGVGSAYAHGVLR